MALERLCGGKESVQQLIVEATRLPQANRFAASSRKVVTSLQGELPADLAQGELHLVTLQTPATADGDMLQAAVRDRTGLQLLFDAE